MAENPDMRIVQGLNKALALIARAMEEIEDIAEWDSGQYLRDAADRLFEAHKTLYPVYQGMMSDPRIKRQA